MKPSKPSRRPRLSGWLSLLVFAGLAIAGTPGSAQQFKVLYTFTGTPDDGVYPLASLVADRYGNLYGTTFGGGPLGSGAVYKLTPSGKETVLYSFENYGYRSGMQTGLVIDSQGNLYGAAPTQDNETPGYYGNIFKIAPAGDATILYTFTGGNDGGGPSLNFISNQRDDIFGATDSGGKYGDGTIFKLSPTGAITTLSALMGSPEISLNAGLIADRYGNFYGLSRGGGENNLGTVVKITPAGKEIILHSFAGGNDGSQPNAGLVADSAGNLYGTTQEGGSANIGTVFKVIPEGKETILHTFTGGNDGATPNASLIIDQHGDLYGTTFSGGKSSVGTIFRLTPEGKETILYSFTGGSDGGFPNSALLADNGGHLFGTASSFTEYGPEPPLANDGTVFRLSLPGAFIGTPGEPDCVERSVSELASQYGGTARAARELGYASVDAMYNAASAYCQCDGK